MQKYTYSQTKDSTAPREVAPFLKSLRRMLLDESEAVLRWTPNGRAFEIHDMQEMTARVLPKYFKHCKYTSFQRQLNYFSFRKWTKSKAIVCTFSNDFFLRDQPELAWRITRKKSLTSHPLPKYRLKAPVAPYWMISTAPGPDFPSVLPAADNRCRLSFPAITDTDLMLKQHDVRYAQLANGSRRHHSLNVAAPISSEPYPASRYPDVRNGSEPFEALDWIDCLLPPSDDMYMCIYPPAAPYPRI